MLHGPPGRGGRGAKNLGLGLLGQRTRRSRPRRAVFRAANGDIEIKVVRAILFHDMELNIDETRVSRAHEGESY